MEDVMRFLQHASPLSQHLVVETHDLDYRTEIVSRICVPHLAELADSRSPFFSRVYATAGPRTSLCYIATSGSLQLSTKPIPNNHLLVVATTGGSPIRASGHTVWLTPDSALLISLLSPTSAWTPPENEGLLILFNDQTLSSELEKLTGQPINAPVAFYPGFDMRSELGNRVRRGVLELCAALNGVSPKEVQSSLAIRLLENNLITDLLAGQRHNYTRILNRRSKAGPWQLRVAEEYLIANAHLPLSLGDIAAVVGVPARTLQYSFKQKRGRSPMQFYRELRLQQVREHLLSAKEDTTVSDIASRWGFLHFGRFAADYQRTFGEKPHETLRGSKLKRKNNGLLYPVAEVLA